MIYIYGKKYNEIKKITGRNHSYSVIEIVKKLIHDIFIILLHENNGLKYSRLKGNVFYKNLFKKLTLKNIFWKKNNIQNYSKIGSEEKN